MPFRSPPPSGPLDEDCGVRTGHIVTLATFGVRRPAAPDLLAERTRLTWTTGDYSRIAVGFAAGAEDFVKRLALQPGERVLDVACGSGNLAIPAARYGADVTGLDIAPNLLDVARENSVRQGLGIRFDEGDAEALPYPDASFATTISMFGVMFAARPARAMAELFRVTRPGGRIVLANWTPSGFVGEMLRVHTSLVPPPPGVPSVLVWGDPDRLQGRLAPFSRQVGAVRFAPAAIEMAFPLTPWGVVELFRENYGPTVRAFATLDAEGRATLSHDLLQLWSRFAHGRDGFTRARAEYLEVWIDIK